MSYYNDALLDDTYIVLDVETTGLNPDNDDVIEICAFLIEKERITKELHTLVNPGYFISKRITEITGITNAMLVGKPKIDEVIYDFERFVKEYIIVGHNINFDLSFLKKAYNFYLNKKFNPPKLCTLELSRKLIPHLKSYKLSSVADYFNIPYDRLHRAKDDVMLSYKIFLKLMEIARRQYDKDPSYTLLKQLVNS